MREIITFKCVICGRDFLKYDKPKKGGAPSKHRVIMPCSRKTCSKKCSLKLREEDYKRYGKKKT